MTSVEIISVPFCDLHRFINCNHVDFTSKALFIVSVLRFTCRRFTHSCFYIHQLLSPRSLTIETSEQILCDCLCHVLKSWYKQFQFSLSLQQHFQITRSVAWANSASWITTRGLFSPTSRAWFAKFTLPGRDLFWQEGILNDREGRKGGLLYKNDDSIKAWQANSFVIFIRSSH